MATNYLYGTVLTGEAVAANNRGDNLGNTTTLQKVFVGDQLHTSVSAEAIRFALRHRFQLQGLNVNRSFDGDRLTWEDEKHQAWDPEADSIFIDDDLMGFMNAEAAKRESEQDDDGGKKSKKKGTTTKRQSPLALGRAVSLRPYRGEISFNAVSGEKKKGELSLYNAEMHTTEYQYTFGLNLEDVIRKEHVGHLIDAIVDPPPVAGNHSRFAYDFSPESIVLRVTNEHSPRIQNCFEHAEHEGSFSLEKLVQKVESGDLPAEELILGGRAASSPHGTRLKELGVAVFSGVKAAASEARKRIRALGDHFQTVSPGAGS